jgi:hypothetical protein
MSTLDVHLHPIAVELDLMDPSRPGRRGRDRFRKLERDEVWGRRHACEHLAAGPDLSTLRQLSEYRRRLYAASASPVVAGRYGYRLPRRDPLPEADDPLERAHGGLGFAL